MTDQYNKIANLAAFLDGPLNRELLVAPFGFVDIGARGGIHDYVASIARLTSVLAFEPDREACEAMRADASLAAPWAKFRLEAVGLADYEGQATLHLMDAPTNHSLLPGNAEFIERYKMVKFAPAGQIDVPVTTLDQVLFGSVPSALEDGELLKIDTQGTELHILRGSQRTLKERTVAVVAEVEFCQIYQGQPLFSEMELFLREFGFSFYGFQSIHLRSGKRIDKTRADGLERALWAEAVFFRDPCRGSAWRVDLSPRQTKVLIIAAILFRYFDFAIELAHLVWPSGEDAESVVTLVNQIAASDMAREVNEVEALANAVRAQPDLARVLVGRFVDRRRSSWDYDDVPRAAGE